MKLLECLENGVFNELINFSFEEVRTLLIGMRIMFPPARQNLS